MEAIKQLRNEGYQVFLVGEDIRCEKMGGVNPDPFKIRKLFDEIKRHKSEAVRYLKEHSVFNKHIEAIIAEFNSHGICMMDVPEATRKRAFKLEAELNDAANREDQEEFLKLLMQWRKCFH